MPRWDWDLGLVRVTTYDADGFLGCQVDLGDGAADGGGPDLEVHHPLGFASRPRDPDERGCTALYAWEGSRGHAWLCGDPRATETLPALEPGGAVMYGSPVPGRTRPTLAVIYGSTGTYQALTPYGSTAHTLALDVATDGAEVVRLEHGAGMGLTMVAGGANAVVLRNRTGAAWLSLDDDGITINASMVKLVGAMALGTQTPSAAQSFAMATPLAAWIAQVVAWMASAVSACAPKGIALPAPPAAPAGLASTMVKGL